MEYPKHFFTNLNKIYKNIDKSYPDLTLHCIEDGSQLKCHRIILSACSEYFTNVFGWSQSNVLEVHNGITGDTMKILLQYIYSGEISITIETVNEILVAANFFNILQVVEACVDFILKNKELDSCVEMLLFSWQVLDQSRLTMELVCYVAQNFSYILNDMERLATLPIKLMAMVLNSDDLVIRHEKTELPTRPAEREKRILDFILEYTKNVNYCDEDITLLLSCVKWRVLDIFNEKEYVVKNFANVLENGVRKEEVLKYLNVTHSDLFSGDTPLFANDVTLPTNLVSEEDKKMYGMRAFSCSELVLLNPLAGENVLTNDSTPFSMIAQEHEHVKRIDLISRLWDGRNVIGGLNIYATSPGAEVVYHSFGISEDDGVQVHVVDLEEGEHITGVHGKSGWLIDELTFETSKGRRFGPFGGGGGATRDVMGTVNVLREEGKIFDRTTYKYHASCAPAPHARIPLDSILVGVSGTRIYDQNNYTMTHLHFCFRLMVPSSAYILLNDKKVERRVNGSSRLFGRNDGNDEESDDGDNYDEMYNYEYYDESDE